MLSSCRHDLSGRCRGQAGAAGSAGCAGRDVGGTADEEPGRLVIDETGSDIDSSEEVDVLTVDPSERKRKKVDGSDSAIGSSAGSPSSLPTSPYADVAAAFDRWCSLGLLATRDWRTASSTDYAGTPLNMDWRFQNMFYKESGLPRFPRSGMFSGMSEWRTNGSDKAVKRHGNENATVAGHQQDRTDDAFSKDLRGGLGTYVRSRSYVGSGLAESRHGRVENNMSEIRRNSPEHILPECKTESSVPKTRKRSAKNFECQKYKAGENVLISERPSVIVNSPRVVDCPAPAVPVESPLLRFPSPPRNKISCKIITQPRSLMRFRYWSEYKDNRAANKIVGKNSTSDTTTYPTIWIDGWSGKAVVVISLVQADNPHRLHPHSLLTPSCEEIKLRQGYIKREVECSATGTLVTLDNLCLIRNKKGQMVNLLRERYQKINPFGVNFDPKDATDIKSHVVRLCIEVYLVVEHAFYRLEPVVSDEIRNSGAHQTLKILKLGFCPPREGDYLQEVMILCDKVDKDDIEVEIVSLGPGSEVLLMRVASCDVFGQVNIVFRVSREFLEENHQHTYVRLRRPSTKDISELFKFSLPQSLSEHDVAGRGRSPASVTRSPSPADPTTVELPTTSSGCTGSPEKALLRPDICRLLEAKAPNLASENESVVNFLSNWKDMERVNRNVSSENSDFTYSSSFLNVCYKIYKKRELDLDRTFDQTSITVDIPDKEDGVSLSNPQEESNILQDICDSSSSEQQRVSLQPLGHYNILETKPENHFHRSENSMITKNSEVDSTLSNIIGTDTYDYIVRQLSGLVEQITM